MERKLTVVLETSAVAIIRRKAMTVATIVGIALVLGCSPSRCHRCHSYARPSCQNRVCQQTGTTSLPVASMEPTCQAMTDSSSAAAGMGNVGAPAATDDAAAVAEPNCSAAMADSGCSNGTAEPDCSVATTAPDDLDLTTKSVGRRGFPSDEGLDSRRPLYGHGEDYEWLMGVLHRVHVPRKGWKVRYAPLDQQDRWGGSVVPAPDVRMDELKDGDNVYVEGEVIRDRASLYVSGPRYRITTIRPVNEGDVGRVSIDR